MGPLDQASELYRRYVKKFNDQEDQIERLRDEIQKLTEEEAELRKALEEHLDGLDLA
jgi:cell division septum initiation protein DivIVA